MLKTPTRARPNNRIYGCHLLICQSHLKKGTSETSLSLCARPRSDVPPAASNEQPELACAHTQARHRAHSLGRRRSTRACGARALRRAGWIRSIPYESPLRQRDGSLPRCTAALCLASSGLQCAVGLRVYARQNATALSLTGGGSSRALAARARCAALVAVGLCPYKKPLRQRDGPFPLCTAALRRASQGLKQEAGLRMCARKSATARSLSREEAQNTRLRRARAAPRCLESVRALWKPTAPARRPSPSMHGRALSCQPRSRISSRLARVRKKNATARSLSGGGAARALTASARFAALVGVGS